MANESWRRRGEAAERRPLAADAYEREETTDLRDSTPDPPRGLPLHYRILIGLAVGTVAGLAANRALGPDDPRVVWLVRNVSEPIGQLFLRLLLMVVVPLVFSSLVVGVAGIGDLRRLGRVGLKSFAYTLAISAISVFIGLALANTLRPGERLSAETRAGLEARYGGAASERVGDAAQARSADAPLLQVVNTLVPSNPVASIATATPNMLHLMFFAVLLGLGLHMFGVYSLSVAFLSRIHPLDFFRRVRTVMLTAFSTSSSNATLPTALRVTEENLGVPREITSFVLTVGATANQNGTALYEGVTVLFLAQLAGVPLDLWQQLGITYFAILGGIGTAGVPSGSIPFIIVMLSTYGINPALIAVILGVDRILDMCRTTLNVTGDITAATYVARSEGYPLLTSG